MTSYTPKGTYPYPAPTDAVTDYPATAATFAGYLDNLPNRNVIINGSFDIWQRGTSPGPAASGAYTADRWRLDWDGTSGSRSVSALTPGLGTSIGGMQPYRVGQLAVNTAATSGTFMRLAQRVEGVRSLAGETATLSFWVMSTVAPKTITIRAVQNFGTGGSPSSAVTTTIGTTTTTTSYVRKSFTFTVPPLTSKTLGTNGDDHLEIHFDVGTQTGIFNFWGVQLEQNTTATALERRPLEDQLRKCQRYYFRTDARYMAFGMAALTTQWVGAMTLPVPLLRAPSSVDQNPTFTTLRLTDALSGFACTALVTFNVSATSPLNVMTLNAFATGLTQFRPYWLDVAAGGGFVAFNAEL